MFKDETVRKLVKILQAMIAFFRKMYRKNPDSIHVCISRGNRKIGRVLNVSLAPIITCCNCKWCKKLCYDIKACLQYVNVRIARAKNTAIVLENMQDYFNQIRVALDHRKKNKFFRWHVAGDIINTEYFENMVKIARDYPDFIFWTYTKAYHIVNMWCDKNGKENLPKNFSIMFSEWRGMPMVNPYNFPEFRVIFKDEKEPENVNICPGNCDICTKNHINCVAGTTTYTHAH